jgi:hypothetical protein
MSLLRGAGLGCQQGAISYWGSRAVGWVRSERGRGLAERERESFASGSSFPLDSNCKRQGEEGFGDLLGPEKILAGLFPPLGRFCKEE